MAYDDFVDRERAARRERKARRAKTTAVHDHEIGPLGASAAQVSRARTVRREELPQRPHLTRTDPPAPEGEPGFGALATAAGAAAFAAVGAVVLYLRSKFTR